MGLPTEAGEAPLFSDVLHIFATRKNTHFFTIFHSSPRVDEKKIFFFYFYNALRYLCKTSNLRSWCFRVKKMNKKILFSLWPPTNLKHRWSSTSYRLYFSHTAVFNSYDECPHTTQDTGGLHSTECSLCVHLNHHYVQSSLHTIAAVYTQLAYTISPPNEVFVLTASHSLSLDSSYLPFRSPHFALIYITSWWSLYINFCYSKKFFVREE